MKPVKSSSVPLPSHLEVAHTHQVERNALGGSHRCALLMNWYFSTARSGAHAEPAAGQHEPRGADLGTVFQRGPHGGHGIRPGSAGRARKSFR